MVKEVNCNNAGYEDCQFLVRSENEDELVTFVQNHARDTHQADVSREQIEQLMTDV